tara:strand:- start:962 stop:1741 length:780 start_codon:yes stop_codon:yes gene_type:complete
MEEEKNLEEDKKEKYRFHMRGSISNEVAEKIKNTIDKASQLLLRKGVHKLVNLANESPSRLACHNDILDKQDCEKLISKTYFTPNYDPGCVYFLKDKYTNHYKIGVTSVSNPFDRIKVHVKYNNNLQLNHLLYCNNCTYLEKYIHNSLSKTKVYDYTSHEFFLVDELNLQGIFEDIIFHEINYNDNKYDHLFFNKDYDEIPIFKRLNKFSDLKNLIQFYSNSTVLFLALQNERPPNYYFSWLKDRKDSYIIDISEGFTI